MMNEVMKFIEEFVSDHKENIIISLTYNKNLNDWQITFKTYWYFNYRIFNEDTYKMDIQEMYNAMPSEPIKEGIK